MKEQALHKEFNAAYGAQSDAIFRFCYLRVSDREQALDITQETFVRFWQTLVKGSHMTNTKAFLFTVAQRLVIDWYRKKKSSSLDEMSGEEGEEYYDPPDENAFDNMEMAAEGRYLVSKLGELQASYREAVYLRFVEGMSPPDIGEVLGISANAVSVRINRGLEELRVKTGYDAPKNG